MAKSLKEQTIKGVSWSAIGQFTLQAIQFLVSVILARLLSPSDYGIVGMIAIFLAISQVFIDGGFSSALIQKKKCTDEDYSTVFYCNLAISIICYLIIFIFSPIIADFYNQPIVKDVARISSISLVLGALSATSNVMLIKKIDFKTQTIILITSALLSGILGILIAYLGFGVWALVAQIIGLSFFKLLATLFYVKWIPSLFFSMESFRDLYSFGFKLLIASLISSIYTNIRSLIIGKRFSPSDLGQFTNANKLSTLSGSTISNILNSVTFPVLSKIQEDNYKLCDIYKKILEVASFIVFPLMFFLSGAAEPIVYILFSEKWLPCVPYFQILCFCWVFDALSRINLNLLYVKKRSDLVLRLELMKKIIAFAILLASFFIGIIGICIGAVIYDIIAFYINTYYTKKLLGLGLAMQVKILFPYCILSLILFFISFAFSSLIINPFISLLTSVSICGLFYLLICYTFRLSAFKELFVIIKNNTK